MKSKYDRPAIKLEFFESEHDEVESFFQDKFKTKTDWSIRKNTKWRPKEKQELKTRIVEKAIQKNAEKQAKELSVPLEELMKWKKAILQLLLLQVSKYVKDSKWDDWTIKEVDVSDAEKILKMFKTELWEPATIWANYNMNANKVEWLTDEESEALDILFSQKVKKPKKSTD